MRPIREAPDGDTWRFCQPNPPAVTYEIWNGRDYMPVLNNNGEIENFRRELVATRMRREYIRALGEYLYKVGQ
jgi:hypothetical protein